MSQRSSACEPPIGSAVRVLRQVDLQTALEVAHRITGHRTEHVSEHGKNAASFVIRDHVKESLNLVRIVDCLHDCMAVLRGVERHFDDFTDTTS